MCTTVTCPVSGSNYLTTVGSKAQAKYTYSTHNGHAVVTSASVAITTADLDKGTDTTSCTQDYSRTLDDDGVQDCDAGHILAHRLGGAGTEPINIFPQDLSVNRGDYAQYEGDIYACLSTGGASKASLSWSFSYESTSHTKPNGVTYSASFTSGSCTSMSKKFSN